ncbi:MAG TPA: putative zinc-binding metallopeptidase, partial [Duganella sp.]|nr:putative zinc-binding metallopeptidase [Duganella sp.]
DWFALTYVLNSLNRSVGTPDSYPFKLPTPVQEKLHFIHKVVLAHVDRNQGKAFRPAVVARAQATSPAPAV